LIAVYLIVIVESCLCCYVVLFVESFIYGTPFFVALNFF